MTFQDTFVAQTTRFTWDLWPKITLRGVGQIMFQNNAWTGLLFLLGIVIAKPLVALGGLFGAIVGLLAAVGLRFDRPGIESGLYGFNAALVGMAAYFYLAFVPWTHVLLVLGCVLSSLVTWLSRRFLPFSTYTGPFIVVTWLVLVMATWLQIPLPPPPPSPPDALDFWEAITEGVAEVMFEANVYTGLIFLLAIAVCDWRHALWAFLGSLIGCLVALYHGDTAASISIGIFGYNGALTAIAVYLYRPSLVYPILGILLSVPLTEFFPRLGVKTLTAPFVLATWIVLALVVLEQRFVVKKEC